MMKNAFIYFAILVVILLKLSDFSSSPYDIKAFQSLPIYHEGRLKPIDTVARTAYTVIREKTSVASDTEATQWLLTLATKPNHKEKIFRISHPDLKLMIAKRPVSKKYFSFDEIQPSLLDIEKYTQRALKLDKKQRSSFQEALIDLYKKIDVYLNTPQLLFTKEIEPLLIAYKNQDHKTFNQILSKTSDKLFLEPLYNSLNLFDLAAWIYLIVFVLALLSYLYPLHISFHLLVSGFLLHSIALFMRLYLHGRPPVTNLYSSAIFIGWVSVLVSVMLRRQVTTLIGSVVGGITLLMAHTLALQGDTMEAMQAVLDSNFWLSTHVVVITLGYAMTLLAAVAGNIYIFRSFFGYRDTYLSDMIYGFVCIGLFFMFTGTVLGGIWADQSWGRFWGWDPKENGALMIIFWDAIILHAKKARLIGQKGLANMAIFGNVMLAFSWFGVNLMGVGLHSYGFTSDLLLYFIAFVGFNLFVIFLSLLDKCLFSMKR